ncbi:MAG TPA: glycoside hydrolase family 43 protein [Candidatus Sulfopaludibacter sp.]|nr:glycoside hydrolase family 43 protein [Candidatus Sulfopaludibacter sp.]
MFSGFSKFWVLIVLVVEATRAADTFTNPIAPSGADPWMIRHGDDYFLVQSRGGHEICVGRAANPVDIGKSRWVTVWKPPSSGPYARQIWAPELHYLQGKWYVYFAADDGNNVHHRIYVLEGTSQNPQNPFVFRGELKLPDDRWAIDGSLFTLSNRLYFIWSGWSGTSNVDQRIYIAELADPLTPIGKSACISVPQYAWEKRDGPPWVNEGPEALRHGGRLFIIYSASGSWADNYCLGQLAFTGGNPLRLESWIKKPEPVFCRTRDVYGPGHCCFVKSPDGTEDWIIYHAAKYSGAGWNRNLRAQKFTWRADGSPDFGTPVSAGVPLPRPAGIMPHP